MNIWTFSIWRCWFIRMLKLWTPSYFQKFHNIFTFQDIFLTFCLYLTAEDDGERGKRDDMRLNSSWDAPSQLIWRYRPTRSVSEQHWNKKTEFVILWILRTHQRQTNSLFFHLSWSLSAVHRWSRKRKYSQCPSLRSLHPHMVQCGEMWSWRQECLSCSIERAASFIYLFIYFTMAPECTLENIQPRTIKPEEEAREVGGGHNHCAFLCLVAWDAPASITIIAEEEEESKWKAIVWMLFGIRPVAHI